jgi:hypothetical protein
MPGIAARALNSFSNAVFPFVSRLLAFVGHLTNKYST